MTNFFKNIKNNLPTVLATMIMMLAASLFTWVSI